MVQYGAEDDRFVLPYEQIDGVLEIGPYVATYVVKDINTLGPYLKPL
jgi:hypothetical protein